MSEANSWGRGRPRPAAMALPSRSGLIEPAAKGRGHAVCGLCPGRKPDQSAEVCPDQPDRRRRKGSFADYRASRAAALADSDFFGLCQGVRNGAEIRAFSKRLGRRVTGTDISTTVLQVPDGFLCDFAEPPPLWFGLVDFLYSNSYDHARDLDQTLACWRRLLSTRGLMFLQFTPAHARDAGLSLAELKGRLEQAGFAVETTLSLAPARGLARAVDLGRNLARQLGKRLLAPLLPKSSRAHWSLGYSLRHGVLGETHVVVARPV